LHYASLRALSSGPTKALSLKQPFAWLIANGYLLVDDRSWGTKYRGQILLHASKGLYNDYYDHLKLNTNIPLPAKDRLEYAGVVGIANLVHCSRQRELPIGMSHEQRASFSGIHQEHFGFLFEQAEPLALMPCRGKLGIFEIDVSELLSRTPSAQSELF